MKTAYITKLPRYIFLIYILLFLFGIINSVSALEVPNRFCVAGYTQEDMNVIRHRYATTPPETASDVSVFCRASIYKRNGIDADNPEDLPNVGVLQIPNDSITPMNYGYLTFFMNKTLSGYYYFEISKWTGSNWTTPEIVYLNTLNGTHESGGGFGFTKTNILVGKGDKIRILLKYLDNFGYTGGSPGISPGWKYIDINNKNTWYSGNTEEPRSTSNQLIQDVINTYQPYSNGIDGYGVGFLLGMGWGDVDKGAADDYWDFNDMFILVALRQPPPLTCSAVDINMTTEPVPAVKGGPLKLTATNNSIYSVRFMSLNQPSPSVLSICWPSSTSNSIISDCTVSGGPGGPYTWSVDYRTYNLNGWPDKWNNCSKTSTFDITGPPPPGYLVTSGGDVYIKDGINMPSYGNFAQVQCQTNQVRCLSDFLYSYNTTITGTASYAYSSKLMTINGGYIDKNTKYMDYNTIKQNIITRAEALPNKYDVFENVNGFNVNQFTSTKQQVIVYQNHLNIAIDTNCNTGSIFIVPGDLTITSDFQIPKTNPTNDKIKGCLFIVNGNVNFIGGNKAGPNAYDTVHAFVIHTSTSNNSLDIPQDSSNILRIVGGIVERDISISSVKRRAQAISTTPLDVPPSVEIIYEGGRYINLFNDIFVNSGSYYNINELPYLNTL